MNARVAHGVLGEALDLIDCLGGIGVTDELGVEVARVIGRPSRENQNRSW